MNCVYSSTASAGIFIFACSVVCGTCCPPLGGWRLSQTHRSGGTGNRYNPADVDRAVVVDLSNAARTFPPSPEGFGGAGTVRGAALTAPGQSPHAFRRTCTDC